MTFSSMSQQPELDIIFQDHHLIAVNKPAGMPVGTEDSGDKTLLEWVREWNAARQQAGKKGYCVPIHFLDRPVSGVIIFALSSKSAARLNEMFRAHKVSKVYWAVAEGGPDTPRAVLEHWLIKDRSTNITRVGVRGDEDAKYCKLTYEVLEAGKSETLIEVRPVTGRSHQIRVQLSAVGCPLFGDKKYGAKSAWNGRVALHAAKLLIHHPVGGQPLELVAPVPRYWNEQWNTFRTIQ